jgi:hypothetical protein
MISERVSPTASLIGIFLSPISHAWLIGNTDPGLRSGQIARQNALASQKVSAWEMISESVSMTASLVSIFLIFYSYAWLIGNTDPGLRSGWIARQNAVASPEKVDRKEEVSVQVGW